MNDHASLLTRRDNQFQSSSNKQLISRWRTADFIQLLRRHRQMRATTTETLKRPGRSRGYNCWGWQRFAPILVSPAPTAAAAATVFRLDMCLATNHFGSCWASREHRSLRLTLSHLVFALGSVANISLQQPGSDHARFDCCLIAIAKEVVRNAGLCLSDISRGASGGGKLQLCLKATRRTVMFEKQAHTRNSHTFRGQGERPAPKADLKP